MRPNADCLVGTKRTLILLFAAASLLGLPEYINAEVVSNSCSDVVGSPASAKFFPNFPLTYSFSGDLAERFQVRGYPTPISGNAFEINNSLVLDTGVGESGFSLAENRIIFPNQSFSVSVKMAIDPNSSGSFQGGVSLVDYTNQNGSTLLLGLSQTDYAPGIEAPQRYIVSVGPSNVFEQVAISIPDMQYVTAQFFFDSSIGVLQVSVPELGVDRFYNLAAFTSGFSIGFQANAWSFSNGLGTFPGRAVLNFSELTSNLVSDVFLVGHYPFTLASNGQLYDRVLDGDIAGTSATLWAESLASKGYWASVPGTIMSLSGTQDLHLFLLTLGGAKTTVFSAVNANDLASFLTSVPNSSIDAYVPNVLRAHGFADYEWVCPSVSELTRIDSASMARATGGDVVVLSGNGFGGAQGASTLTVGGRVLLVTSWSDTSISFTVPFDLTAGSVSAFVTVRTPEGGASSSNAISLAIFPNIVSLKPSAGFDDSVVSFVGSNFGDSNGDSAAMIGGFPVAVSSWSQTLIVGTVPTALAAGPAPAEVTVRNQVSYPVTFTLRPKIELIYPVIAIARDILTIYGRKFGSATSTSLPPGTWVMVGGETAEVISWAPDQIQVFVPERAKVGHTTVYVTVNYTQSNEVPFEVERSRNPQLFCYEQYGRMVSAFQLLANDMDRLAPTLTALIGGLTGQSGFGAAITDGGVPELGNTVATLRDMASRADAVLDNGCYKWIPIATATGASRRSQTAAVVTNLIVAGALCSTKALGNDPVRQCGYYPGSLPVNLANNPLLPFLSQLPIFQALGSITSGTDFANLRLTGEWDRGEAVILSALGHTLLAGFDVLLGVQTGTSAVSELGEAESIPRGVERLRALGKVAAHDPKYLSADRSQTAQLQSFASDLSMATLRFSQISEEFEADLDNQADDYLVWNDTSQDGFIDGADEIAINMGNDALRIHGLSIVRILHVMNNWNEQGIWSLSSAFTQPQFAVRLPPGLSRNKVDGAKVFFARVSRALASVNDPSLDDTITSQELGEILFRHGILRNPPKGIAKVHMRKAFSLLQQQGLRPLLPRNIQDEFGEPILAVENEVSPGEDVFAINADMSDGDTRHFATSGAEPLATDCAAPGQSSRKEFFYFDFVDPTFNGALEINGEVFDDGCTPRSPMGPPTNLLLNKWLVSLGGSEGVAAVVSLAENRTINILRNLMVGNTSVLAATQVK